MEEAGIVLIECKPYGARIMPRSCGLRALKARVLAKRGPVLTGGQLLPAAGLEGIEKCLTCPDAREAGDADMCAESDCHEPAGTGGRCKKHTGMTKAKERREKKMPEKETVIKEPRPCEKCGEKNAEDRYFLFRGLCRKCRQADGGAEQPTQSERGIATKEDVVCGRCGRPKSERPLKFNFKRKRCNACLMAEYKTAKHGPPKRGYKKQQMNINVMSPSFSTAELKKCFAESTDRAGLESVPINKLLMTLREKAAEFKKLYAAMKTIRDVGGLDIEVPEISELMRDDE